MMGAMATMIEDILMESPWISGLAWPGIFWVAIMLTSLMMVRSTF